MQSKIADHLLGLIREAQENPDADDELIGDSYKLVDQVRHGHIDEVVPILARDPDYQLAFEYLLGVADGIALLQGRDARPEAVQAAAEEAGDERA